MKREISLDGQWKLSFYDTLDGKKHDVDDPETVVTVPAMVPGNVELDLSRAGLLPEDLFRGMVTRENEKLESYDWWYEKEFDTPVLMPGEQAFLEFDGVDCMATYYLNGEEFGQSENAQMAHRFAVTELLRPEGNLLRVHIRNVFPETF